MLLRKGSLADHPPKPCWWRLSPQMALNRRLPGDHIRRPSLDTIPGEHPWRASPRGAALLAEPLPSLPAKAPNPAFSCSKYPILGFFCPKREEWHGFARGARSGLCSVPAVMVLPPAGAAEGAPTQPGPFGGPRAPPGSAVGILGLGAQQIQPVPLAHPWSSPVVLTWRVCLRRDN